MSVIKFYKQLIISIFLCLLATTIVHSQSILGGQSIASRPNCPANSIGNESNWYIDWTTGNVYGPKTSGQWPCTPITTLGLTGTSPTYTSLSILGTNTTPTSDGQIALYTNTTRTAQSIYTPIFGVGYANYDLNRAVLDLEPGTTIQNANTYASYIYNNTPNGSIPHQAIPVSYFSLCSVIVANASCWAMNFNENDSPDGTTGHSVAAGLVGIEGDYGTWNAGTIVEAFSLSIGGPAQASSAVAFQVNAGGGSSVGRWTGGISINAGAIVNDNYALFIGSYQTSGTTVNSAKIGLGLLDSSSTGHYLQIYGAPVATNAALAVSDNISANGLLLQTAVTGFAPTIQPFGGDSNINLQLTGKGTGNVVINGGLTVINGNSSFVDNIVSQGTFYQNGNLSGSFTAGVANSLALGFNLSAGGAEGDYINTDTSAVISHSWYQMNTINTFTLLASLGPTGVFNAIGGLSVNGVAGLIQTCTVNQAKTLVFSKGLLTGGTCNT